MGFERAICTEELFAALGLPEHFRDRYGHPVGSKIVFDRAAKVALILEAYSHADPPRYLFYVRSDCLYASIDVGEPRAIDQIKLHFDEKMDDERCKTIFALFESAMRLAENYYDFPLPITWGKGWPSPRTTNIVIEKLNQLCNDPFEIESSEVALADLDELKILSVVSVALIPDEILALREYVRKRGWRGMSPAAQEVMKKVFPRINKTWR